MTTNERMYLQMLMRDPERQNEACGWILEKRCCATAVYLQWMRDGEWQQIIDDNEAIINQRKQERLGWHK